MDAHPDVGIIQTAPLPVGRQTLFARVVQFGARLNGPMLSAGLAYWQLGGRPITGVTTPSSDCRRSPTIVICRACRARRRWWGNSQPRFRGGRVHAPGGLKVWLIPDLKGSWEEVPSNIIDFAARDRRWAQGNLQHMKVLILPRLNWVNRVHMINGILSYVTSPMWFAVTAAQFHHYLSGSGAGLSVLRVRHAHVVSSVAAVS